MSEENKEQNEVNSEENKPIEEMDIKNFQEVLLNFCKNLGQYVDPQLDENGKELEFSIMRFLSNNEKQLFTLTLREEDSIVIRK